MNAMRIGAVGAVCAALALVACAGASEAPPEPATGYGWSGPSSGNAAALHRCERECLARMGRDDEVVRPICRDKCERALAEMAEQRQDRAAQQAAADDWLRRQQQAERQAAEAKRKADDERATLAASCASDREQRRQQRDAYEGARRARKQQAEAAAKAAADAKDREQERLHAYQVAHCRKEIETQSDRVPCDDGSSYVRMCDVVVSQSVVYVCPPSSPAAIRGRHYDGVIYVNPAESVAQPDPSRVARLAGPDIAPVAGDDEDRPPTAARDAECREFDEAEEGSAQ